MKVSKLLLIGLCCLAIETAYGDEVVWKGELKADGVPSAVVPLELDQRYVIKVSNFVNLGKWVQAGEKLATDACYEFSKAKALDKVESVRNSQNVSVCDGRYHDDHVYLSQPFVAKQNRIHFWVQDTDYDDNHGSFQIEVIHKTSR